MATWRSGTVNALSASAGSSWNATRTITAGDLVVVCFTWEDSQTLSSVSDTAGGTWAIATQSARAGSPQPIGAIAYCLNHPGGSTTITATLSGTANPLLEMDVMCFTPAGGTSFALDQVMTPVTGASASTFTGNTITTTAPGVVVEFLSGYQLTSGVTAGGSPTFTRDTATENNGNGRSFAQYLLSGSAQSVTPGASWGALTNQYVFLAAAFAEVTLGPTFTAQPANATVFEGDAAVFAAAATGSGSVTYQWQDNRGGSFANTTDGVTPSSSAHRTPGLLLSANGRRYRVVATDSSGSTNSTDVAVIVLPRDYGDKARRRRDTRGGRRMFTDIREW